MRLALAPKVVGVEQAEVVGAALGKRRLGIIESCQKFT
jgi:hypothetical protein